MCCGSVTSGARSLGMTTSGARSRGYGGWSVRGRTHQRRSRLRDRLRNPPRTTPILLGRFRFSMVLRPVFCRRFSARGLSVSTSKPTHTADYKGPFSPFSHRSLSSALGAGCILAGVAFSPKESYSGRARSNTTMYTIISDQAAYPPGFLRPGASFGRGNRLQRTIVLFPERWRPGYALAGSLCPKGASSRIQGRYEEER